MKTHHLSLLRGAALLETASELRFDLSLVGCCGTGSDEVAKFGAVECWLEENLRDIAMDVGPDGVVVVTTDEGTSGDTQLPTIIVLGQSADGTASALSCTDGAACATSTFYDHGSTIRALEDAFAAQDTTGSIGCSRLSGPVDGSPDTGFGYDCIHATPLPIKLAQGPAVATP